MSPEELARYLRRTDRADLAYWARQPWAELLAQDVGGEHWSMRPPKLIEWGAAFRDTVAAGTFWFVRGKLTPLGRAVAAIIEKEGK
jgi:hypothetical protein